MFVCVLAIGQTENLRRASTPHSQTAPPKKKLKTPVVTVEIPAAKSFCVKGRKIVNSKFAPPPPQEASAKKQASLSE